MRLLLIGAFPFPLPQGSQVFFTEQALALAKAGAEVALTTYGSGEGAPPGDLAWLPTSRVLSPRRLRSGFSAKKPLADAALAASVLRAHRQRRFDLALAHNVEAAFAAAAARSLGGPPFVYVAHTLMGEELSAYFSARWSAWAERVGGWLDRRSARSADGVIALSTHAEQALAPHGRGPLEHIPPGLDAAPLPDAQAQALACERRGLAPRSFFLYAGNLDRYQDLAVLAAAARALGTDALPIVVATHDASGAGEALAPLRIEVLKDVAELRALSAAARALLLPRTRRGGFPIKLLNYMEAARPIVAFAHVAEGLVHGRSGWLLPPRAGAQSWAEALRALVARPVYGDALGAAARDHLLREHAWPRLAERTLILLEGALRSSLR